MHPLPLSGCSFQYFNVLVGVRFAWQGRSARQQDSKVPVKQSEEMAILIGPNQFMCEKDKWCEKLCGFLICLSKIGILAHKHTQLIL